MHRCTNAAPPSMYAAAEIHWLPNCQHSAQDGAIISFCGLTEYSGCNLP